NNYMAHYDTYEADLKDCQQNPGGVNCGAILSLTEGTNARYLGMTQGGYRVAANMGKDGAASYTVVSPNGEMMVMQPTEWAYFSQMTSGQQATIFAGSQWQLDLTSATEYGLAGDTTAAMANYAHMLTQPDYWIGMGAALIPTSVLGRTAGMTNQLATGTNKAMFWSGLGRGGDKIAARAAAQQGKMTLESTLAARGIKLPKWDPDNPEVVSAWRQASHDFAAGARGNVRVLQGDVLRGNSVWAEVEFPALKANPTVKSITSIDAATGKEVLLWSR
ncbi:hypothetical protein, partial [Halothiobacillus neapolitanus]